MKELRGVSFTRRDAANRALEGWGFQTRQTRTTRDVVYYHVIQTPDRES